MTVLNHSFPASLKLLHGHVFAGNVLGDVAADLAGGFAEELLTVAGLGPAAAEEALVRVKVNK